MSVRILVGDCREVMRALEPESIQCVATSPPYYGLRNYQLSPSVWGGDPACEHVFGAPVTKLGGAGFQGKNGDRANRAILIEANPDYAEMGRQRLVRNGGIFCEVVIECATREAAE